MNEENKKGPSGVAETNPMMCLDAIVRNKVFNSRYWKEDCFGLNAETLVDKAIELDSIGGTHSSTGKPTPFLCLLAKLLQISPEKEIIFEFIKNRDYKYVNALALMYFRLIGKPKEIYQILELFYSDYRKIRIRNLDSTYSIIRMDEFVDQMLREDLLFDISLPRLPKRFFLEEQGQILARKSAIEQELVIEEEPKQDQQIQQEENADQVERSRSRKKEKKVKNKDDQGEKKKKFKFKHKHRKDKDNGKQNE